MKDPDDAKSPEAPADEGAGTTPPEPVPDDQAAASEPRRVRCLNNEGDISIDYLKTSPEDARDEWPGAYNAVLGKMFQKKESERDGSETEETVCDYKLPPEVENQTLPRRRGTKGLFLLSVVILLGGGWFIIDHWVKSQNLIFEFSWQSLSQPIKVKSGKAPLRKTPLETASEQLAEANELFKKKNYKESLSLYEKSVKILDPDSKTSLTMGECHERLNQPKLAAECFDRAIEDGLDDLTLLLRQADWHMRTKNLDRAFSLLSKAKDIYKYNSKIHEKLGEFHCLTGDDARAVEAFDQCQIATLGMANLKRYARLMEDADEIETARQLYMLGARKQKDLTCSLKAVQYLEDPEEKVFFLSSALSILDEDKRKNVSIKVALAENLLLVGKPAEAFDILRDLKLSKIGKPMLARIAKVLCECADETYLREAISTIMTEYDRDLRAHEDLQATMCLTGHYDLCVELYETWSENQNDDPRAYYLYARVVENPISANVNYRRAMRLLPTFYQAFLEMGKLHLIQNQTDSALKRFHRSSRLRPAWLESARLIALTTLLSDANLEAKMYAVDDYQRSLERLPLKESEKSRELVDVALKLPSRERVKRHLDSMRAKHGESDDYQFLKLKNALIEGKTKLDDFASLDDPRVRELYPLHLLASERAEDVLALPESNSPFINFWKCFIRWRDDLGDWRSKAETLGRLESGETIANIASSLWLDKITIDQAKKLGSHLNPETFPLLHFIIAEKNRKNGDKIKSKVHYVKALKDQRGVYRGVIDKYLRISGNTVTTATAD